MKKAPKKCYCLFTHQNGELYIHQDGFVLGNKTKAIKNAKLQSHKTDFDQDESLVLYEMNIIAEHK